MKIKKVENKEKPEYDTKSEKQNKFLKLIFEHKLMSITIIIALILALGLIPLFINSRNYIEPESGVMYYEPPILEDQE